MNAPSAALAQPGTPASSRSLLDHRALPWLLTALGLFSCYVPIDYAAALRDLRLPDTDDAMRLAQVRDLLAGQGWFDLVQYRFLPPEGVPSHWSRFVDAPLAGMIALLTPLVGRSGAEAVTVLAWPPLLGLAYGAVLYRGLKTLLPMRAVLLALFAATQTLGLTIQFAPGRIDHHNLQIIVVLGLGLCVMQPERGARTGLLAGVLAAASLAIGLEALPLIAIAALVLLGEWIVIGQARLPVFRGFALGVSGISLILFAAQTAPALWTAPACDALSPPWLWLATSGAGLALAASLTASVRERMAPRLMLALGVGTIAVAGFVLMFPACLHGPFPDMPALVRERWLGRVREMQPLFALLAERPAEGLAFCACLFVAFAAACFLAIRDGAHRRVFALTALFLGAGTIQTVSQLRGIYVASGFVPIVAGYCLDRAFRAASDTLRPIPQRLGLFALAIALNSQAWLVAGALAEPALGIRPEESGRQGASACSAAASLRPLDGLAPGTVLAPIDLGPYLLVHTHHAIVAAPYHRAIAGLTAAIRMLDGDADALREEARRTGAAYLVLCPGKRDDGAADGFAARLARGETAPDWLEPLPLAGSTLKAWRIRSGG